MQKSALVMRNSIIGWRIFLAFSSGLFQVAPPALTPPFFLDRTSNVPALVCVRLLHGCDMEAGRISSGKARKAK